MAGTRGPGPCAPRVERTLLREEQTKSLLNYFALQKQNTKLSNPTPKNRSMLAVCHPRHCMADNVMDKAPTAFNKRRAHITACLDGDDQLFDIPQRKKSKSVEQNDIVSQKTPIDKKQTTDGIVRPKTSSSKYRGVCWLKKRKAWRARIEMNGKREHLGYFDSEEKAARAYDARALELNGPSARLNFVAPETRTSNQQLHDHSALQQQLLAQQRFGQTARNYQLPVLNIYQQNQLTHEQALVLAEADVLFIPQCNKWAVTYNQAGESKIGALFQTRAAALSTAAAVRLQLSEEATSSPLSAMSTPLSSPTHGIPQQTMQQTMGGLEHSSHLEALMSLKNQFPWKI